MFCLHFITCLSMITSMPDAFGRPSPATNPQYPVQYSKF
uniref:Uncharacterized protein n=1 Tax=Anguilla anguilla TaxID=7936 RepID=A0A0E9PHM3_ANGAN